jgi:aminomethyltransferase
MPQGTPFHARTAALNAGLLWRDWAGHFAASAYEVHHEREYNAIRNAAALIDISPLYKYRIAGRDACRLIDRLVTRDATRIAPGQVGYACWCDAAGKVLDDGTLARVEEDVYRWTAAEPNLRWIRQNARGLEVSVEDVSEAVAALALQGPTSRDVLRACAEADVAGLRYFRLVRGRIAGVPVEISRTGYTGDLGYELFLPAGGAAAVWDALAAAGAAYGLTPTGMLALDVARIEAGLILLDVDYTSARKAQAAEQLVSPGEIGLARLVHLDKAPFVGQAALRRELERGGPARRLVGLEADWADVERLYDEHGLAPELPAAASRVAVPVYRDGRQLGKATSTTWSPTLKKLVALAQLRAEDAAPGTRVELELTVLARRRTAGATVVALPFFDPPRKKA